LADQPVLAISFKDIEADQDVREALEKRCVALAAEFPETTHIEVSITAEGDGFSAHAHVTGRQTEAATHGNASEMAPAAEMAVARLEKQLRRSHDKKIFGHRREAMQQNPKRGQG